MLGGGGQGQGQGKLVVDFFFFFGGGGGICPHFFGGCVFVLLLFCAVPEPVPSTITAHTDPTDLRYQPDESAIHTMLNSCTGHTNLTPMSLDAQPPPKTNQILNPKRETPNLEP